MATQQQFHQFWEDLAHGVHDFSSDDIRAVLSNVAPDPAGDAVLADITQVANGNGYTTGGVTLSLTSSGQTSGVYLYIPADNPTAWTASGAGITWRYVVFYNDTATGDPLISWIDRGTSVNTPAGTSIPLNFGAEGLVKLSKVA